jgi:ketosteroid isomerase-like protein
MSRLGALLYRKDHTQPWSGRYAPYDLVKEACIAIGVIALLAVVLSILFSSPDEKPSTIAQWSRQQPVNFLAAASKELAGTSDTATYGPPYNHNGEGQHAAFLYPQKWLGVSHPIDTARDFVVDPLRTVPDDAALAGALAQFQAAPAATRKAWAEAFAKPLEEHETAIEEGKTPNGDVALNAATGAVTVRSAAAGPVPAMMSALLDLAKSGGLDGSLLTSRQFFQTDYTKPLLFMADGGLLGERAEAQHLLGEQWGMMNETGSYPGQAWLWLYALWYQVEPFKSSENADILVMLIMGVLSLAFVCIPLIPGVRDLPRAIPVHRLIWREHYRATGP